MSQPRQSVAISEPETSLKRVLGPFDATCVVIGAIIGIGVFFTPARVAAVAGTAELALAAWATGGVIALCGALTFAELGTRYPRAGGQYDVLRDAFGPPAGFLFVFCNATAVQAGAIAIIALLCAQNLLFALHGAAPAAGMTALLAAALVIVITFANVMGVRVGSGIQNLTVLFKLATLAVIVLLAALYGSGPMSASAPASASPDRTPSLLVIALFSAIVPSFFAYGGWQHALWIAGEVRDPRRMLPIAIVGGVAIVVAAYLAVNWAYLALLGHAGVATSKALAADAVARVWPHGGSTAISAAVAISALGVLNAQLLSGPRLLFRLSQDGRFFSFFSQVDGVTGTPARAVYLLGGLGLMLLIGAAVLSSDAIAAVDRLTTGVVFIDGVFFALTALALFVFRRRERRNAVPPPRQAFLGFPVAPAMFILGEVGILVGAYAEESTRSAAIIGIAWIAVALLIYMAWFRRRVTL